MTPQVKNHPIDIILDDFQKITGTYLVLFEAPSGVWERDDPGLDTVGLGADRFL